MNYIFRDSFLQDRSACLACSQLYFIYLSSEASTIQCWYWINSIRTRLTFRWVSLVQSFHGLCSSMSRLGLAPTSLVARSNHQYHQLSSNHCYHQLKYNPNYVGVWRLISINCLRSTYTINSNNKVALDALPIETSNLRHKMEVSEQSSS